jgi:hypothetical protein
VRTHCSRQPPHTLCSSVNTFPWDCKRPLHSLCLLPVCPAQAEVSAVNSERERIRANAAQAEQRITALETELETAKQVRGPLCFGMISV